MENQELKKTSPDQSKVSNEIMPVNNEIVKFDPEQDIKQGQKAAKALMKVVEITKPLKLGGKTYLYFEHWQTMAKFFRMTVGTEWVKEVKNQSGTVVGYEAKAVVYQSGTVVGGAEGTCLRDEKNWMGKPEFQLKSMAQTRAMAKALRSILGYIPVLAGIEATPAEEMNNEPESHQTQNSAPTSEETPKGDKQATDKQIGLIKSLMTQKEISKLSDIGLREEKPLSSAYASTIIKRLMEHQPEDKIITFEDYPK